VAKRIALVDPELGPLTRDRLTRDFVVLQRAVGHRFSVDDVATAWVASRSMESPRTILDLGCGLGSVLLHLAWVHRESRLVGIEAQAASFELARRNVRANGLESRIGLVHADLAEACTETFDSAPFHLVTGTPPYFDAQAATRARDPQRAFARIEYRGGIEVYVRVGASVLANGGRLVLCGPLAAEERLGDAATRGGLHVVARTVFVGREGRPPLFAVWTLAHARQSCEEHEITIRDRSGRRTEAARDLTRFSGFEPTS
jgi:tRNA1(Val) A37 N6-methylase TrmN6